MAGRAVLSDDEEEMNEEEAEPAGDAVDLDERDGDGDGDDDEEEEDEEGQNEYEADGFIVDDEEEEEEKDDSDEERHRRKRKKRRDAEKTFVLDEDDYELLQDNNITGFRRPKPGNKFKRLKKAGRDSDAGERSGFSDEEESDRNSKGGRTAEEKLKRSLFGDDEAVPLEDIAEEEEQPEEEIGGDDMGDGEEDEMADFIVDEEDVDEEGNVVRRRKSVKKKKVRRASGVSSSALQEAQEIFGDPEELMSRRKQKRAAEHSDGRLEDEFEPFILSEKYMMPMDDRIRETDIPERIQLFEDITGPPPTDDKSIEEESTWILSQLIGGINSPLPGMEDVVKEINKEDIVNVLTMMHVQKFEVPFIAMYRKELCTSLLKDPSSDVQDEKSKVRWHKMLWAIHTLDRKWLLLQKRKRALQSYYNKRFDEEARRIDDETRHALDRQLFESIDEALKDAKSEREVDDVDAKFNLHFPPGEVDTEQGQYKRPKRKSLYSICYKAGLWEVANKFSINSEKFGLFLALEEVRREDLEDAKETPEEIAASFTCQMFGTPQDVLKGARHMAAVEIGCEPIVRKYVRTVFMEKAVVSTAPTSEGNTIVDSSHQLAGVKWLRNKPISEFKDAQWLLIQKAEEEKLLQVTIKLPDDTQKKLLGDADEYYLSEGVSKSAQLWNEQRKMILEDSFFTYILTSLEKEARSLLHSRAKNWLLMEYGKHLWNKVSVAPYQRKEKDAENEDGDDLGTRVLACCWGPGKPATTFVMLDSAGELVDLLYAGSLSVRSKGVAEQQRKKNDEQRVMKFVTDHQPQVVCLGGANLSCRQLKDDLYEVLFKIVEDHPKEYGQDIHITLLDESLPRLYENSRVSSDQLAGQSGIVKRAVGLGRYLQNPLAMVATLCGPGKEILSWKICPLEDFLTPDEKYEVVEQVMVDATNQIGVDINLAASHEWLFAPLQFVSGLGPRKATALQKTFVRSGSISTRKEIMGKFVKKKVFINSAGFMRVHSTTANDSQYDILDDTRIHPESYELAHNLAKDVCRESDIDDEELEMAIEIVRDRPEMLEALDIDEYAKSKAELSGTNKRETLYLIKMELLHNFQDLRIPFKDLEPEEEFALLSGETEDTLSVGRVVQVTVRQIQENRIVCTFDTGLRAFVSANDYSEDGINPDTIQHRVGDMLTAEIKGIDVNRYLVYLTCNKKYRSRNQHIHKLDPYYHEEKNVRNEQEKARKEKELAKKHFKPRMIVHPRFQNLTADEAMEYLSEKDAGESIIRPSSKGPSYLTLTLKVYDGVYAHKDIVEGGKDHKDMTSLLRLGKTLTIDEETFEDLDEVMDRYVDPLVSHLKNMLSYRKFRRGTKAEVDDLLRAEKADNPTRIVYSFGISHEHPGTFILSYIKSSTARHEYIGLYPKGFRFRKKDFSDIDRLVAFFQKNIDKPPIDSLKSNAQLSAVVPMKSPGWGSGGGSVGGDSAGNNDGWKDRERSSTPGNRYESRNNGAGRDNHPSGIPRPGRGRGRGNNEDRDSSFASPKWSSGTKDEDGLSSFPGAKVQNSPGKEWFPGGGSGGSGGWGNSSSADNDGGGWGNTSSAGNDDGGGWGSNGGAGSGGGTSGGWGNTGSAGNDGGGWGNNGDAGRGGAGSGSDGNDHNGGGGWGGGGGRNGGRGRGRGRGGRDGGWGRSGGGGGGRDNGSGWGSAGEGGGRGGRNGFWGGRNGAGRDGGGGGGWSSGGDTGGGGGGRDNGSGWGSAGEGGGRGGRNGRNGAGRDGGGGGGWSSGGDTGGGGRGGRGRGRGGGGGGGGRGWGGDTGGGNAGEGAGSGWGSGWGSGSGDGGAAPSPAPVAAPGKGWGSGSGDGGAAPSPAPAATPGKGWGGGWGSGSGDDGPAPSPAPAAVPGKGWGSGSGDGGAAPSPAPAGTPGKGWGSGWGSGSGDGGAAPSPAPAPAATPGKGWGSDIVASGPSAPDSAGKGSSGSGWGGGW